MNRVILTSIAAVAVFFISCPYIMAHATDFHVLMDNGHGKIVDEGDIIIHNDEGGKARITTAGNLFINGKKVAVNTSQKTQLTKYVATVKDIEAKGEQLGKDAAGFAASVLADVFTGLFTGEDEDKINHKAEARAHVFKQKALPICTDVQSLKHTQNELVAGMPAFRAYAIIRGTDAHACERDINSDN